MRQKKQNWSCIGFVVLFAWLTASCAQKGTDPASLVAWRMPAGFCYVDEVAPEIQADLKYAGSDNFVGRPIAGYEGSRAILRRDAAVALGHAAGILRQQGYGLMIWDAYRPMRALRDFRAWSYSPDEGTRASFYPRITKRKIYQEHYIGDSSEHTWGIAVDITLYRLKDGKLEDMGGRHDLMDTRSATDSTEVTCQQRFNRGILRDAMRAVGFENYPKEWWHYRLENSRPWFAYDFPVSDNLQRDGVR